jgi:Phage derived protein Gp49-like (DUF891)
MTSALKSWPCTVIYDPDAVVEFVTAVKSKDERKAIFNAVDKLRELGERLPPPHMKPLQGEAAGLRELRPRRGSSDWRALYRRYGSLYVVLAVDRHANFPALVARAHARAARYT